MTDLPPFSVNPTCPKCGDYLVRSTWMDAAPSAPERVLRHCTCGYSWLEAPLDAAPADHADCDHRDGSGSAVYWNPYNGVVQCHRCGVIFEPTQTIAVPFAADVAVAGEPAEPSIPVSRIVAALERVIAENIWRQDIPKDGTPDRVPFEHAWAMRRASKDIGAMLGVRIRLTHELARRKGTA